MTKRRGRASSARQQVLRFRRKHADGKKKITAALVASNVALPIRARSIPENQDFHLLCSQQVIYRHNEKKEGKQGEKEAPRHAPEDIERRKAAAAATTAADCGADDLRAAAAAAAMGALAVAPRPADLAAAEPTLPPERQEREAAILTRRREMVTKEEREREKIFLNKK